MRRIVLTWETGKWAKETEQAILAAVLAMLKAAQIVQPDSAVVVRDAPSITIDLHAYRRIIKDQIGSSVNLIPGQYVYIGEEGKR